MAEAAPSFPVLRRRRCKDFLGKEVVSKEIEHSKLSMDAGVWK
jgi:hypothetical protein